MNSETLNKLIESSLNDERDELYNLLFKQKLRLMQPDYSKRYEQISVYKKNQRACLNAVGAIEVLADKFWQDVKLSGEYGEGDHTGDAPYIQFDANGFKEHDAELSTLAMLKALVKALTENLKPALHDILHIDDLIDEALNKGREHIYEASELLVSPYPARVSMFVLKKFFFYVESVLQLYIRVKPRLSVVDREMVGKHLMYHFFRVVDYWLNVFCAVYGMNFWGRDKLDYVLNEYRKMAGLDEKYVDNQY